MNPRLLGLMRHLFPDCRSAEAAHFRRECQALEKRLGPFDDVTLQYAVGVVTFSLAFQSDSKARQRAELARTLGKGRRPTVAAIERLKRREGLSWGSYDQAMKRLEELAKAPRRTNPFIKTA